MAAVVWVRGQASRALTPGALARLLAAGFGFLRRDDRGALASRDVDGIAAESRHDKDLAIAHAPGARHFNDLTHRFFDAAIFHPQRHFHFGQEGERVYAVAILIEITLLPALAFDFTHIERFERRALQRIEHLLGQKRFHNGDDLLQRTSGE